MENRRSAKGKIGASRSRSVGQQRFHLRHELLVSPLRLANKKTPTYRPSAPTTKFSGVTPENFVVGADGRYVGVFLFANRRGLTSNSWRRWNRCWPTDRDREAPILPLADRRFSMSA